MDTRPSLGPVLITGGAGFIGLALAWHLRQSADVVLLDSLRHKADLQTQWANSSGARLVVGDVRDKDVLARAMDTCRSVVHLASLAGVDRVRAHPEETTETILGGTRTLLETCEKTSSVRRILLASTSEVYGVHANRNDEYETGSSLPDGDPRWSYAEAKLAAERMGLAFGSEHGVEVFVIRPFNVYGPGQLGRGAVETFTRRALGTEPLDVFDGGQQVRAWCFISDILRGIEAVLRAKDLRSRIFNLGNPEAALTTRQLAQRIIALTGSRSPVRNKNHGGAEVELRVPQITRAVDELGFRPMVDLELGLKHTVAWYRQWVENSQPLAPWEGDFGL